MTFQILPRLERRLKPSRWLEGAVPVASVLLAVVCGSLILLAVGANPLIAYRNMIVSAFGSLDGFSETLVKATPLLLCGLGVMLSFRMRFWNIGAEGQIYIGAMAASGFALSGVQWSSWTILTVMFFAALLAGALWGLIPAYLKARHGVNEIITTLMMNYIAILWVSYLVYGPWRSPSNFPITNVFPDEATLVPFGDTRLTWGFIYALVAVAGLYFLQEKSTWGYQIRVTGENARAARYAGIKINRNILLVMVIAGGLAGLAGFQEVAGIQYRLLRDLSPGYGYTAVIVAFLGKRHPIGVLIAAVLLGGLFVGGEAIQISMKLPVSLVFILQGLILFFVLGGEINTRYRIVWGRRRLAADAPDAPGAPAA
ncbi:MAG: ABC transporter permease [Nitrospinota bacterium]